jgi:hypothetical protein
VDLEEAAGVAKQDGVAGAPCTHSSRTV